MPDQQKILAVDDSTTIRKALELILVPAGYDVEFAVDGGDALQKVASFRPDVILLDFILPDMRGSEVCRRLAADPETAKIPVVLISARGAEIRQAYNDADNVIDYIAKPFTPEQVIGVLTEVASLSADRSAARRERAEATAGNGADLDHEEAETAAVEATSDEDGWSDASVEIGDDGDSWDDLPAGTAPGDSTEQRQAGFEVMFDTLRAALEGVYVEEADTPSGAAADHAKSYTEVARKLAEQIGETLEQAESGEPFHLCSDGSVRSLSDSLLETHRRVCRLLFRATDGGAVDSTPSRNRPRLLAVFQEDGDLASTWQAASETNDWHLFAVSSHFRQLPLMTRLYGPTHLVVDARLGSAAWDQIGIVRSMPEGRRMRIIGIVRSGDAANGAGSDAQTLADLGIETHVVTGPNVIEELRARVWGKAGEDVTPATHTETVEASA